MDYPDSTELPFFAYGLLRPGQPAYFQLRESVERASAAQAPGSLWIRDGLPILNPTEWGTVDGALLTFRPAQARAAYGRIAAMEPEKQYRWHEAEIGGGRANLLIGRSPESGSDP